jgi:hypothetical protein
MPMLMMSVLSLPNAADRQAASGTSRTTPAIHMQPFVEKALTANRGRRAGSLRKIPDNTHHSSCTGWPPPGCWAGEFGVGLLDCVWLLHLVMCVVLGCWLHLLGKPGSCCRSRQSPLTAGADSAEARAGLHRVIGVIPSFSIPVRPHIMSDLVHFQPHRLQDIITARRLPPQVHELRVQK